MSAAPCDFEQGESFAREKINADHAPYHLFFVIINFINGSSLHVFQEWLVHSHCIKNIYG